MKNNILEIKNLKKNYHTMQGEIEAVDNFSFNLSEGEFIAIVGPSGCGKSTILSILGGLEKKSAGEITINDEISMGYMLQQDGLFDWLNIYENCLLGLKIRKKLEEKNKKYVESLLKKYGLIDFADKYPNNLSGGMRQRVALIRTLATKPDILLLDEPFSALDYQSRLAVSDDVYNIIKNENKSVIMVTHDIAEAISMADIVIVLNNRPTSIKSIYKINLSNKSSPIENRKAKEFAKYYDKIWKDIDY
ncbi:MAG: ABC transporter ATP-binding protein, partial [Bacilli bacterium]|nr:ABC transporter ATP-binding protein [Bacilli bacterium]